MAIWQYTFHFIPRSAFTDADNFSIQLDKDGLFDEEPFWRLTPTDISIFEHLGNILPRGKSWSDEVLLFGASEKNCVEVVVEEDNLIGSAMLRIDHTSQYEDLLRNILEFTIANSLIILNEDWQTVPPNFEAVKAVIENSQARRTYKSLLELEEDD